MKTTKKGFTLIELIVVIAIIGVLAAILVPSMLGYVKKSKIQSANSTASSIYKAVNSAATEFEEEDKYVADKDYTVSSTGVSTTASTPTPTPTPSTPAGAATNAEFYDAIKNYFGGITKCSGAMFTVEAGMCKAVACKSGQYLGTYPAGIVTPKNWASSWKGKDVTSALSAAKVEAAK